jgi:hypothetical protein
MTAPKVCELPPAPSCLDANTVRTYASTGTCTASGDCDYASVDTPCAEG